jgi:hypothetical protein
MVLERPVEIGTFVIETNTFSGGTTIVASAAMLDLVFRGKVDEPDAGSLRSGSPTASPLKSPLVSARTTACRSSRPDVSRPHPASV